MLFNKKIKKLVFVALLAISSLNAGIEYDRQNQMATCDSLTDAINFLERDDKSITKFHFENDDSNNPFNFNDLESLADSIQSNDTITELSLDFSYKNIPPFIIELLATAIKYNLNITNVSLCLEGNGLRSEDIIPLTDAINYNYYITKLNFDLSKNNIGPAGIEYLFGEIANNPYLTELSLNLSGNNKFKFDEFGINCIDYIATAIKYNRNLTKLSLNLSGCFAQKGDIIKLTDALAKNKTIKSLNLNLTDNNFIDDADEASSLATVIKNSKTITKLSLILSDMEHCEMILFADAITNNKTITNLNFGLINKQIEDDDIKSLSAAIKNNTIIKKLLLNLESDNLDLNTLKPIAAAIRKNEVIKQFILLCPQSNYKSMWDISEFFYNTIDSNKVKTNITFK